MAYIEFKNVVKQFGKNTVLNEINLDINKGELVTLLGPSGCGKSTLLRCLSGLESVTSGQIILDGQDITNMPASQRNIGMVFQQYSLFPNMNVEQNIAFGLKMQKRSADEIEKKVRDAIALVDLKGKEKSYPANLSGGQRNAWRWRAPSSPNQRCCSSTNRSQPSTPSCAKNCRRASARSISSWV